MAEIERSSDIDKRREEARWSVGLDRQDGPGGSFYSYEPRPELHLLVKRVAAQDLKECQWSREEVAIGLSKLVGRRVSQAQIDAMLAESKTHRLPAEWIPAWVRVTGSKRLLELLCAEAGYWLADATEHDLAELSRVEFERQRAEARAAELRKRLMEKL